MSFQLDGQFASRILPPPARTLLTTASEDISNAAWGKTGLTVSTGRTGPDGAAVAEGVFETSANSAHEIQQDAIVTLVNGTRYLQEAIFKPIGSGRYLLLQTFASSFASGAQAYFDFANLRVGYFAHYGADLVVETAEIYPLAGGYVICRMYFRATSNNAVDWSYWTFSQTLNANSAYAGDTSKGFDVYRAAIYSVP